MRTRLRALPALAASALHVMSVAACSQTVATDDLETEVEKVATGAKLDVDSVDCPDELPAEVDKSVVCTVTQTDGKEVSVDVTTSSVNGDNVNFKVEPR